MDDKPAGIRWDARKRREEPVYLRYGRLCFADSRGAPGGPFEGIENNPLHRRPDHDRGGRLPSQEPAYYDDSGDRDIMETRDDDLK